MSAYYNEFDPKAAAWLRELIKKNLIAPGEVDERSITDVRADELIGFTQCHFFAGIGGWSYALRRAGWPDNRPAWTASLPCQPFSIAGKHAAIADERHLWPAFYQLVQARRPVVAIGEQVSSRDALEWFDHVQADLGRAGYTVGCLDTCAAGIGAPHIRQRLYWVANINGERHEGRNQSGHQLTDKRTPGSGCAMDRLADARRLGHEFDGFKMGGETSSDQGAKKERERTWLDDGNGSGPNRLENTNSKRFDEFGVRLFPRGPQQKGIETAWRGEAGRPGPTNGFWRDADWLGCRDGKWRPVKPGSFPLVDGPAARVVRGSDNGTPIDADKTSEALAMRLRGYGNAINAELAAEFVKAVICEIQQ